MEEFTIDEFKWSPIAPRTHLDRYPSREFLEVRKANMKVTTVFWIKLSPVVADYRWLYNPQTPILIWLN